MEISNRKELDTEEHSKSRHYQHYNKYTLHSKRGINKTFGNCVKLPKYRHHLYSYSHFSKIEDKKISKAEIKKLLS